MVVFPFVPVTPTNRVPSGKSLKPSSTSDHTGIPRVFPVPGRRVVDVLLGAQNEKVLKFGHDEIAAYGWDPSPQPDLLITAAFFTIRTEPLDE